jgi:hypothetical protein
MWDDVRRFFVHQRREASEAARGVERRSAIERTDAPRLVLCADLEDVDSADGDPRATLPRRHKQLLFYKVQHELACNLCA